MPARCATAPVPFTTAVVLASHKATATATETSSMRWANAAATAKRMSTPTESVTRTKCRGVWIPMRAITIILQPTTTGRALRLMSVASAVGQESLKATATATETSSMRWVSAVARVLPMRMLTAYAMT